MEKAKTDPKVRLLSQVNTQSDGCWEWLGRYLQNGYGAFFLNGKGMAAHRAAYILLVGEIEPRKHLHHLCGNKKCVRPDHLQALSSIDHGKAHRGAGAAQRQRDKQQCPKGHPYDEENTYRTKKGRHCRACSREWHWKNTGRVRPEGPPTANGKHCSDRTHCPAGHPYEGDNLIIQNRSGGGMSRVCRACGRDADRRYYQKNQQKKKE